MKNYELGTNEVILYEDIIRHSKVKGSVELTLTSQKIIFEKEKGILKKEKELIDIINLEDIKIYNDKVQIQQKGVEVNIQTINENIKISFYSMFKANKFVTNIINTITGTTITKRGTDKINTAINTVNDVLGIDTRDTLKEVIENGIAGTLIKGIKRKNKK
ncbi:MAG: hypothetical protein HFJ41_06320 [Clostridia bacterium]|nr:hypothetical protein [Clostridia bacterium]